MKTKNRQFLAMSAALALTLSIAVTSCKKDKDDSGSSVQFSASVNGSAYQPSGVLAVDFDDLIEITGARVTSGDTSWLSVGIPSSATANTDYDFDDATLDYITPTGEYASGLSRSHGTVSVTTVDKSNKKVAGKFSGVLYKFNSSTDSVVIANGQFNTTYISQ
jgi:hypothetical protein